MNQGASELPQYDDAAETEARLRRLAWLLDDSIRLPGGYRIGIDGLVGLIPGLGDAVGAMLSSYLVFEARRMGAPKSLVARMIGNVFIETVVGAVPVLGDLFDFVFKANARNVALLDRYQRDPVTSRRRDRLAVTGVSAGLVLLLAMLVAIPVLLILALVKVISA